MSLKSYEMKKLVKKFKWQLLYPIKSIFFIFGKSWNDFYSFLLDYQDRKLTIDDILSKKNPSNRSKGLWHWEKGIDYLNYMVKHGYKPYHKILDLGCGYGRCTIPILKFQNNKGYYIGSEISKKRLSLAKEWIRKEKILNTNYDLILSKDIKLNFIKDNSIDIVWVLSVFNHMPDETLYATIEALMHKVKKKGKIFAFYVNNHNSFEKSIKFFPRTDEEMKQVAKKFKFNPKIMKDWEHEYEPENRAPHSKMMLMEKI